MNRKSIRQKAVLLRTQGKTYGEIAHVLGKIPKGTLSTWLHDVRIPAKGRKRRNRVVARQLHSARQKALSANLVLRKEYFDGMRVKNRHLMVHMANKEVAKLLLSVLYIAEGSKGKRNASLVFGNSDPRIIQMFLNLLRSCYSINEQKFRCTVQCRADMPSKSLERYWSRITMIPRQQFYATNIDPRSIGKVTNKLGYKGVCRVQYFSAAIFHELMTIFEMISEQSH